MKSAAPNVLTINGGSSSIRFAVFEAGKVMRQRLAGKIDRIGLSGATLIVDGAGVSPRMLPCSAAGSHRDAAKFLLDWLLTQPVFSSVIAAGHRVVHGMKHSRPERVTPKLLAELHRITPYDPDHLPREIELIEELERRLPMIPQVACFDTAFHRTMPAVARLIPIPRRYAAKGMERYGFHGLSFAYLMEELTRLDPVAAKGRVILAHLGNGASLAAVRGGKSVDTSMGFTPSSGLVMSTRSGDLDPGMAYYLARTQKMTASKFQHMVNHESGLLGISGSSSDLRDLCSRESRDQRAAQAVQLFCYQVSKWIGSFAAALGGLDTLVFSAGIGENSPLIRKRICKDLDFLGIELNSLQNRCNAPVISQVLAPVKVRVIHTNEELMIARSVTRLLNLTVARRK